MNDASPGKGMDQGKALQSPSADFVHTSMAVRDACLTLLQAKSDRLSKMISRIRRKGGSMPEIPCCPPLFLCANR